MAENNFVQNATSDIVIDALMGVTDPAAVATDILLDQLIDALISHYAQAASDIEEKGAKYFNKFKDADAKKFADFQAGKITKEDYTKWRAQKMLTGDHYKDLRDVLVSDMNNANQIATDIINNKKPDVYALNHNYGVYEIEHATGLTTSYTLYDHNTVENLISENPQILPKNKIDIPADKKWNMQKINNALTQGVLQGESVPDISKRLREVTDMNKNAAIRNARTAVTGAQNAGRDDSYKRAESMGIPVDQIWISTLDGRTRHSHRAMMGEVRKGKTFSNGLRYPGDPWGAGEEVYNCRCTMIANVNDVDYGIEDMVNRKLKEKGMTWDEWVNEQPLPKHYNESKAHYLERYSEYKKNLSFSDWLEDQAAPDSLIESAFGNKTWSNLFYEIYDKSHEDANLFKKELTKIANQNGVKPKDIWNQYLTGQLDAEDFNAFETALKKHLPPTESIVNAAQVVDKIDNLDNISDVAKQAESQLKFTKGTPMTKEQADNYKVNPLYDKSNYGSTHNCQTATFAYECRRQGYDVVALPKMVDKNNVALAEYGDIGSKQKQLAQNQANGWINKQTGLPPEMLFSGDSNIKENLEKIIGTNGERYSLSVNWKSGSAHAMNIERDSNGVIRVIDNQRGPLEKNTWTLDEYLSMHNVSGIKAVYRLDDCIPNPEYFNSIVVDASKMKKSLPNKVSDLASKDYGQLHKIAKTTNDSPSVYYTKYKYGIIDNSDLDKIFNTTPKVADKIDDTAEALKEFKKNLSTTDIADILDEAANTGHVFTPSYWEKYVKGEVDSDFLDDIIKKKMNSSILPDWVTDKNFDLVSAATGEVLNKAEELKKIKNMAATDMDDLVKQLQNKYFSLSVDDAKKIAIQSGFNLPETVVNKVDDTLDALKDSLKNKTLNDVFSSNESLWQDITEELNNKNKIGSINAYWNHYIAGEINDPALDELLKKHLSKAPEKTDDILDIIKNKYGVKTADGAAKALAYSDLNAFDILIKFDQGSEGIKYSPVELAEKYIKGEIKIPKLDEYLNASSTLKSAVPSSTENVTELLKKKFSMTDTGDIADKLWQIPEVYDAAAEALKNSSYTSPWQYLSDYADGKIVNKKIDDILELDKFVTPKTAEKITEKTDDIAAIAKKEIEKIEKTGSSYYSIFNELEKIDTDLAVALNDEIIHLKHEEHFINKHETLNAYLNGDLKSDKLDEIFTKFYGDKLSSTTAKTVTTTPEVDLFALQKKKATTIYNELKSEGTAGKFWKELGSHGDSPSKTWEKYLNGELSDEASKKIDAFLINKYSKGGVSGQTAKTIQTAEKSEELIKAQEKLKKAQDELEEIKKELTQIPNKTYSGIWYQDVTLADYEVKQSALAAKKQYFYDQIEELEHCIDDPDSWQFKKYGGEEGLNKKIAEFEKHIDDLNEFEIKGKEYLDEKTKIDKKIKKAEKAVTDAQDEVRQLTPVGEAFTQERKDAAIWAKNKTDEYKKVDKYYDGPAAKVHATRTSIETQGYEHYTWGSMPFNSPLAGYKGDRYTNFVGVNKVDIDVGGYGDRIRGLTSLIEKSTYDKDFWMQSAQGHETIEAFLGIPMGTLRNMTVEEAQQFVGVQNEIPQFISGAVNKYGGSYNPGNMTINIYVPTGSEALYVRSDGHFGKNEHEMILQRGGTYKVTKIYKGTGTHGSNEWIVDLEVHPEYGYDKFQQTK